MDILIFVYIWVFLGANCDRQTHRQTDKVISRDAYTSKNTSQDYGSCHSCTPPDETNVYIHDTKVIGNWNVSVKAEIKGTGRDIK